MNSYRRDQFQQLHQKKGLRCIELKCFIQNEADNINDPKLGDSQVVTVRRPALSWAPLPSFSYRGARFSYWDALSLSQFLFDWFVHCCGIRTLLLLEVVHVHIKWSLLDSESGLRFSCTGFLPAAFSPTVAVSLQPSHRWVISIQVCQSIFMQEIKNIFIKICQKKAFLSNCFETDISILVCQYRHFHPNLPKYF